MSEQLTNAIAEKDFTLAQQLVTREVMERISVKIDELRSDMTKNLFKSAMNEGKNYKINDRVNVFTTDSGKKELLYSGYIDSIDGDIVHITSGYHSNQPAHANQKAIHKINLKDKKISIVKESRVFKTKEGEYAEDKGREAIPDSEKVGRGDSKEVDDALVKKYEDKIEKPKYPKGLARNDSPKFKDFDKK